MGFGWCVSVPRWHGGAPWGRGPGQPADFCGNCPAGCGGFGRSCCGGGYLPLRRVSVSGGPPFMPGEGLERGPQGFRKPVSELMFWGAKVRT